MFWRNFFVIAAGSYGAFMLLGNDTVRNAITPPSQALSSVIGPDGVLAVLNGLAGAGALYFLSRA